MSVKKNYTLTSRQQLVDLNGDTTNFDLSFIVTSIDGSPFNLIVVDQNTLDNNPNLDYKHVDSGTISGNIISDKNIYENYYLCLKSDKNCEVEITIDKKEIPPTIPPNIPPNIPANIPHLVPKAPQYTHTQSSVIHPMKRTNWKLILIVIIVICGGLYLYYLYNKKKEASSNMIKLPIAEAPIVEAPIVEVPIVEAPSNIIKIPIVEAPSEHLVKNNDLQSLIQRLNNLPVK